MKRFFKAMTGCIMAGVLALCMCQTAFAAGTGEFDPPGNLLEDPGLEDQNIQYWNCDSNTGYLYSSGELVPPHSGLYCAGYLPNKDVNKPAFIYQDVYIPEDGMYEFSGYFATAAESVSIMVGDHIATFPGNNRVWERQSLMFYATAGETVTIQIESIHHQEVTTRIVIGVGFWMDDVCLTRCFGTSFEEVERDVGNFWEVEGAEPVFDYDNAKQDETFLQYNAGQDLHISINTEMEPGEYMVSFYAKLPEGDLQSAVFDVIYIPTTDCVTTVGCELTDKWTYVTMETSIINDEYTYPEFIINSANAETIFIDNLVATRIGDVPPVEKLSNGGFESNFSSWNEVGNAVAFTTSEQAYAGKQSLYMGYFTPEPMNDYLEQTVYSSSGSYQFSAYVKTHNSLSGDGAVLVLQAENSQGKVIATSQSAPLSNSEGAWKRISTSIYAPYGTYRINVKIGGVNCTGAFYADGLSLLYSA